MTDHQAYAPLIRPAIVEMEPYTPIIPFEVLSEQLGFPADQLIKLDANENPYGPSPAALAALSTLSDTVPIYPDPEARNLRALLAEFVGVDAETIMAGAGADELIDLVMRVFVQPGDAIINCPPTFGMYSFDGALNGANVINVNRLPDFSLDINAIEQTVAEHQPKLLFICSPNNPDGGVIEAHSLERLLQLPVVLVLDEAYVEFADVPSRAERVPDNPNLIVLRTFSKWAGLAGLRIGYGIFPLWIMAHLWKIKQPYNVNVAADAVARASLADVETLLARVEQIKADRRRLFTALQQIDFLEPVPGQANFILCRVTRGNAAQLKHRLATEHGILIRYFDKPGQRDQVRISVGTPPQTDKLIDVLAHIDPGQ